MTLIPADPKPADAPGSEQCPVCGQWLKPLVNARWIRVHKRPVGEHGWQYRCSGSQTGDEREFVVIATGVRLHVTGRRSAEVVAASYPDVTIWQEDGS